MNDNIQKKEQDSKKILTLVILIAVFMVSTTGATYAYFAISATISNQMSGTAATASLVITNTPSGSTNVSTIPYVAPTTTANQALKMVPQISYTGSTNVLQKAFNGASGKDKCVDANGNAICKAYTFVVKNLSTAAVDVRGYVQFSFSSGSTFTNLRWKLMDSATAVTLSTKTASSTFSATAPIIASTSKVYFDTSNVALAEGNGNKQYWLIVWIEETGADQNATDKGTWYATVGFEAFNESGTSIGGITSTITS